MSGTRLNSKLEDLASSISVVTKQQMSDFVRVISALFVRMQSNLVYDDVIAKLVASGIPKNEIAAVHGSEIVGLTIFMMSTGDV